MKYVQVQIGALVVPTQSTNSIIYDVFLVLFSRVLDYNISTFKRSFNSLRKRERCFSSGWSFKDWSQGRRIPNDYKKQLWPRLIVRVVDDSDCNGYISFDEMFYPKYPVIPDTSDKICTFSRAPTCQGEEGALLHCGYYAMGFYSFNVKTCDPHVSPTI